MTRGAMRNCVLRPRLVIVASCWSRSNRRRAAGGTERGLSRDQRRTALCVTNVPVERAAQAVGYVRRCGEALAQIDAEVVASSSLDAEHSVRAHKMASGLWNPRHSIVAYT